MDGEKQQRTARDLDGIGDEHDFALGHGVGKRAHKRCQHDIRDREKQFQ